MKLVYVGFAFEHHKNTHAGYHHIKDFIKYDYFIECQSFYDCQLKHPKCIVSRALRRLFFLLWGTPAIPWYILRIIWLSATHDDLTFHFVYGENLFRPCLSMFRRKNRFICTLHQPFAWFIENGWERELKCLDKVILVGNSEYEKFAEILGKSKVVYIPHGIDCSFYCPSEDGKKERLVLTVGNWLRDYQFANKVYQRLLSNDPELRVCLVTNPNNKKYITESPRINFMIGITDEQLLELYRKCSVLFLPLVRYTANNSLLEAGASGCNIVIASDNNDNSYIPDDLLITSHMDVDETVDAILPLIGKLDSNIALSGFVNENYAWEIVAAYTNKELRI